MMESSGSAAGVGFEPICGLEDRGGVGYVQDTLGATFRSWAPTGDRSRWLIVWRDHVSIDTTGGSPAMDYNEHNRTYAGFIKGTKYLTIAVILTLVLMAIFLL